MASRLELHEELCELLGSRNVYFSPPESTKMLYDCIRYRMSGVAQHYADNASFKNTNRYEIITISSDPDSDLYLKILGHFQMCKFENSYVANNLIHNVLTLYY